MESNTIKEKIANLPLEPGVYIYRDTRGSILYVGKAKKLRNRVRSYFQERSIQSGQFRQWFGKLRI